MFCALLCVEAPLVSARPAARMDSAGKPACELCGRRLADVKHQHRHGLGHACHPRCKPRQQTSNREAAHAAAAAPATSRKRRAASDPGESPEPAATQPLTRRVNAPEPASTSKKQYNTRREEQIMRLLNETHARRMAAEEAAEAAAAGERGATHNGFTLAFVP
jgi:hypothetical protein